MKTPIIALVVILFSFYASAQQLPVGTWSLISGKGIDAEGKPFSMDRTNTRELKIITSTHYMIIRHSLQNDSIKFAWSIAGKVKFEGNKYYEYFERCSEPGLDLKTDFIFKVDADKFIQSGTIFFKDGKKVTLEELVFERVKGIEVDKNYGGLGVWDQLSSNYKTFDGQEGSHTNATATRFEIVTPSHWMRMNIRDNKFESVLAGTYSVNGNKIDRKFEFGSYLMNFDGYKIDVEEEISGDKRFVKAKVIAPDGKTMTWNDVFVRVGKI